MFRRPWLLTRRCHPAPAGRRARLRVEPLEGRDLPSLAPAGPEFRVNSSTAGGQFYPLVAGDAYGNFVVAWAAAGQDDSTTHHAQRSTSAGVALGPEFRVNSTTDGSQVYPQIAMDPAGDFIIAWCSGLQGNFGVYAQRFSAAGVPQGGEFRVNTSTPQ